MPRDYGPSFNPQEKKYQFGQTIKAKRSSGEIEDDWKFISVEPNSGRALISKEEGGKTLTKSIDLKTLEQWQAETATPNSEEQERPSEDESKFLDLLEKMHNMAQTVYKFRDKLGTDGMHEIAGVINDLNATVKPFYISKIGEDRASNLVNDWIRNQKTET